MGHDVRRVPYGCAQILRRQKRVRIKEVRFGRSFTELAQDQLDGDARAPNRGLPKHDAWVNLDAV
jgi:hypothetical protein